MQVILFKRVIRDLKKHCFRYLALFFLIILGMYMVISMAGGADMVESTVYSSSIKNNVEDGEFSLFFPLTDSEKSELESEGVILEEKFYMDYTLSDNSVLRVFKNREKINLIQIDEGRLGYGKDELVIEKKFAENHNIQLGSNVKIGETNFKVVGIGSTPDYDCVLKSLADATAQSEIFGTAFVSKDVFEDLEVADTNSTTITYEYSYKEGENFDAEDIKAYLKERDIPAVNDILDNQSLAQTNENIDVTLNLLNFVEKENNPRIYASVDDVMIIKYAGLVAGILVLALFTYVISVFVVHNIETESSVIGTLYAMGLRKKELVRHYLILPTLITLVAGLIGTILGFSKIGAGIMGAENSAYYSIPELRMTYPIYLILYGVVLPPVISLLINYLFINNKLSLSALNMIRKNTKTKVQKPLKLKGDNFISKFQIRLFIREYRVNITLIVGMFFSILILILGLDCYTCCRNMYLDNKEDVKFSYMYLYKFPGITIPEGGEIGYAETLNKEIYGYNFDITLLGIEEDNSYFHFNLSSGENLIAISNSTAAKYNLNVGDNIVLSDENKDVTYTFEVDQIVDYSVGLYAFMDINSMRELFEKEDGYFNVAISNNKLNIDDSNLYTTITKEEILKNAEVFITIMKDMFMMMIIVSIIIFVIVMYLMLKVILERSTTNISLFKILGYRNREIRKLYLDGNFVMVMVGAIFSITICKLIVDKIYPICFVANVACGMNYKFQWFLYPIIYIGVILCYIMINFALMIKIKRVSINEVLKNRE